MQIEATIRVPAVVYALAPGVEPLREGVSMTPERVLYIDGYRIGEVIPGAHAVRADAEMIELVGGAYREQVVRSTQVDCVLELPTPRTECSVEAMVAVMRGRFEWGHETTPTEDELREFAAELLATTEGCE